MLDEAIAKLDACIDEIDIWPGSDSPDIPRLRAAVRDVALAAVGTQPHLHEYENVNSPCDPSAVMEVSSGCPRCCCEAEIERQFGLPEGSGNPP